MILFIYRSLKAFGVVLILLLWEVVVSAGFLLVISINALLYCVWIPCLTIRSCYRRHRYSIPIKATWNQSVHLGNPHDYNPENTIKKKAQELLVEPASNVFWNIRHKIFCTQ